jgi:DNA-binding winged helix-turn-helix (wHTH) protein
MPNTLLRFGEFELNSRKYELRRSGRPVKLERIPMELLVLLVESQGTLVTRETIIERLWGKDVYLETERGINTAINKIRSVLRDDPRQPQYLQTVIGKGYRFVAEVVEVEERKLGTQSAPLTVAPTDGLYQAQPTDITETATPPASSEKTEPSLVPGRATRFRLQGWFDVIIDSWKLRIAVGSVILVGVAAVFLYRGFHQVSAIGPGNAVVLAEFTNTTGDTVYDGSLIRALASALKQSPYISLLTPQKVAATLKLMERPSAERLTKDIAKEVCVRSGSKVYIAGAISQSADKYPISLKAINCETNLVVASARAEAESRDQVLNKLGDAAVELRRRLGESLPSIEEHNHPIYQLVTTSSLEALQAAELGYHKSSVGDFQGAIAAFQKALTVDPNFAVGYVMIGSTYANFGQAGTGKLYLQRAYELRDRMTDDERLRFETFYYDVVTGETDKEMQAYAELAKLLPNDSWIPMNAGWLYEQLGQYDQALQRASEASQKQANSFIIQENLMAIYRSLGRYDEAIAVYDEAANQEILNTYAHLQRYLVAFIQNDKVTMQQQVDAMKDMPNGAELSLQALANTAAYEGRLREARILVARAAEAAISENQPERTAQWKAYQAVLEGAFGNSALARELTSQALSLNKESNTKEYAALALARSGDVAHAQQLADELNQDAPVSTFVQGYWLPTIRAAIAFSQKKPQQALDDLRAAEPYEQSWETFGNLFPVYLRGLAYLALGHGKESAAEFQKFIDHRGIVANNPLGALAHLQLAHAYVVAGDKFAAKHKYEDFLALWKNADPDIPVLKEAKAEYAKLQRESQSTPGPDPLSPAPHPSFRLSGIDKLR